MSPEIKGSEQLLYEHFVLAILMFSMIIWISQINLALTWSFATIAASVLPLLSHSLEQVETF